MGGLFNGGDHHLGPEGMAQFLGQGLFPRGPEYLSRDASHGPLARIRCLAISQARS